VLWKEMQRNLFVTLAHVLSLLDSSLVVDAVAQPANQAAHAALETLWPAREPHGPVLSLTLDRAYLSSPFLGARTAQGLTIIAKESREMLGVTSKLR